MLDRWRETHRAAALSQLRWCLDDHPAYTLYPEAHRGVWLLLPSGEAGERLRARGGRLTADEHGAGLEGYARCFEAWASGAGQLAIDARAPLEVNASAIADFVLSDTPPARQAPAAPVGPTMAAPTAARRGEVEIVIGHDPELPVLGQGLTPLRALADLERASVGFWLEAWAAEALIHLRQGAPARVCAPLCPEAVARAWPDLEAVGELARLMEHEGVVLGWRPPSPELFAPLSSPAGARRLWAVYTDALTSLAAGAGWPRWPALMEPS